MELFNTGQQALSGFGYTDSSSQWDLFIVGSGLFVEFTDK